MIERNREICPDGGAQIFTIVRADFTSNGCIDACTLVKSFEKEKDAKKFLKTLYNRSKYTKFSIEPTYLYSNYHEY